MPSAITPLANLTLGANQTTVTFSSIVGTYRDLLLVIQGGPASSASISVKANGNASGYSYVTFEGNGTSLYSAVNSSTQYEDSYNVHVEYAGTNETVYELHFFDYARTDKHKSALFKIGSYGAALGLYAERWASTSAITSLDLTHSGAISWRSGTTFSLYGVSA